MSRNDTASEKKSSIQIVNGVAHLITTSPSQLNTYGDCARKWWYDKRAKQPRKPASKGQARGTLGHERIETYLLTGQDQRDQVELAGAYLLELYEPYAPRHYLSPVALTPGLPKSKFDAEIAKARALAPLKVEESIGDISTPAGVKLIGFSDLFLAPGLIDHPIDERNPAAGTLLQAHVVDHKFKKDLSQYGATMAELQTDPQAIIYSYSALLRWPETKIVRFSHHSHQTQGRKDAKPTTIKLTRDEVLAKWARLSSIIDEKMRPDAKKNRETDLSPNRDACRKYGGCDFETVCPDSPRNRFLAKIPGVTRLGIHLEESKEMGLLDTMNAAKAAAAAAAGNTPAQTPATAPAQTPATAPAAPATQATAAHTTAAEFIPAGMAVKDRLYFVDNRIGKCAGQMGAKTVWVDSANAMFTSESTSPVRLADSDPVALKAFGIAPAEAAPTPAPVVTHAQAHDNVVAKLAHQPGFIAPGVTGAGNAINPPGGTPPAANPTEQAAAQAAAQAQAQALVNAGGVATATVAQAPVAAPASTPAPAAEAPAEAPKKRGRPRKTAQDVATGQAQSNKLSGLILIVDGAVNGDVDLDLTDYVQNLVDALCGAQTPPIPDPAMADPKGPLGFGAWRGALRAMALQSVPDGVCTIRSGELSDPVIEALASRATLVIYGNR